jgi:cysteine desulfurase/selenocysteine lyase
MDAIAAHEHELAVHMLDVLPRINGVRVIGPTDTIDRGGIVSFTLGDIHPHDVGQVLDELGIAVRVGHHCAKPTCLRFGVPATTRASVYLYTTKAEIDALADGLEQVKRYFG